MTAAFIERAVLTTRAYSELLTDPAYVPASSETTPWPKAVNERIRQVMELDDVPLEARTLVAAGFARQQVRREGLS